MPIAEPWYAIDAHPGGVLRLREHAIDPFAVGDIWLVRGRERLLAVDTGSGIVPLAPRVAAIAGALPVTALACNPYFDHAGGWGGFAERLCHPLDAPALADPRAENASLAAYLNAGTLRALPRAGFCVERHAMRPATPTGTVTDGARLDLGGRVLEVLHVPGRSPGGLALWEEASGSLFTSDMLYDGAHGAAWPPDDPAAYSESVRRMRALPVVQVFPGHYGPMEPARMREVIDAQLADLAA
jgi:glyoxylase-like metal-dependent hydrolase (beta-lactamase superfamily II)